MKLEKYKSVYAESAEQGKKSPVKKSQKILKLEGIQRKLQRIKRSLREEEGQEDEASNAEIIADAVEELNDVIIDLIDDLGASHPAVSATIDAVSDLETEQTIEEAGIEEAGSEAAV